MNTRAFFPRLRRLLRPTRRSLLRHVSLVEVLCARKKRASARTARARDDGMQRKRRRFLSFCLPATLARSRKAAPLFSHIRASKAPAACAVPQIGCVCVPRAREVRRRTRARRSWEARQRRLCQWLELDEEAHEEDEEEARLFDSLAASLWTQEAVSAAAPVIAQTCFRTLSAQPRGERWKNSSAAEEESSEAASAEA